MQGLNLHGELLKGGKWTGVMGMLTDRQVDASCSDLTMTTSRVDVVDFIEPVWTDRYLYNNIYHILFEVQISMRLTINYVKPSDNYMHHLLKRKELSIFLTECMHLFPPTVTLNSNIFPKYYHSFGCCNEDYVLCAVQTKYYIRSHCTGR